MVRGSDLASRLLGAAPGAFLTAEFVAFDLAYYLGRPTGNDARLYLAAAQAWVTGGDPWGIDVGGELFAGPPLTLLPLLPFVWMSPDVFTLGVMLSSLIAAVAVVRHLRLPYWWLLFPPLVETLSAGSINVLVLALLLTRFEWAAVVTKLYAGLPSAVLGHTRQLLIVAGIVLLTLPFLPWREYFSHDQAAILATQTNGGRSAWIDPLLLMPVAVLALFFLGRERAAWLSIPVLWPRTQFAYSIFALPARPSMLAAAVLAVPMPGAPVAAVVAEAVLVRWRARRSATRGAQALSTHERDPIPVKVVG